MIKRLVTIACRCRIDALVVSVLLASSSLVAAEPLPETIDFNRDIRPLLSDTCFHCHGPDEAKRATEFRLDLQESAFSDLGDHRAIVPGKPLESELYLRISAEDEAERMPPEDSDRQLTKRQISLIKKWIEQGAPWQRHWSFSPLKSPQLPPTSQDAWIRNPIDAFVLARLRQEGLKPSPVAERTRLLRRVTLDLTGLPPTLAEIEAFLADDSPQAYEKVVDRLLGSPRYGEQMAAQWLDAARYADTNGYQTDGERYMWRWRDWVIEAFNNNMPFDQFTIEQLAGDMLENPTLEQLIATGFNRNHRGNGEGGVIEEEYAVEYVVDRVETTGTVWLGLTIGCARCHEHKYDPISQMEFYQLFAFFNNVPERGRAVKTGNSPPMIKAPTRPQRKQLADLQQRIDSSAGEFERLQPEIASAEAAWEKTLDRDQPIQWSIDEALLAHYELNGSPDSRIEQENVSAKISGGEPAFTAGLLGQAASFDGKWMVEGGDLANFGYYDKFSLTAWIYPEEVSRGAIVSRMDADEHSEGYSFCFHDGKLQLNLVKRWLDDSLRVETEQSFEPGRWYHVGVTYDGSRVAEGIKFFVDGKQVELKIILDDLNQTFKSEHPLLIGGGGAAERFRGLIDDVRVYTQPLKPAEMEIVATADSITEIVSTSPAERSGQQRRKLREYFLQQQAPETIQQAYRHLVGLRNEQEKLIESFPTVMVMQEMDPPRQTHLLLRGEYDKLGDPVSPGVPVNLAPFPKDAPRNRLGLARWLVDPANPLPARVTVNRYWQKYFGLGLVKTTEDLGSQGEQPSHPQLLDWLAAEFIESGWDVKAMQKMIVMSATYRQSSKVTAELLERDPENRLLARGPRHRLSAGAIRDQALAVSGLLVEKLGGESVRPYQPAGLWKEISGHVYKPDSGDSLYRRSMYTYWKRTVAPPTMMAFDAAGRETCIVRQTCTNTPLQALTLLNETAFVESARNLAQRAMLEGGETPRSRIVHAFRLATARRPTDTELNILVGGFEVHHTTYAADLEAAQAVVGIGESPVEEKLNVGELAAYTAITGLILNLDETVTKE